MKKFINSFINYVVNLIIAVSLSFSFVYALTTTFNMTYETKDVLMIVSFASVIGSILFASRLTLKISIVALVLAAVGGLFYLLKNPLVFELFYNKVTAVFLWLVEYINGEVPLSMEYQKYILLALSFVVSFVVYIVAVKKFNFYVLLIAGISLFVAQWMLEYFSSYLSFYIFLIFIILCYFKHIYLRNTKAGKGSSRQVPVTFLIFSVPICALVFILAWYMPASDKPIEWEWMDSKVNWVQSYVKTELNIGNTEYFTISSTGFSEDSIRLGGNVRLDDTLVMKVDSPESSVYLKGAVRELYTGFSWESVDTGLTALGETLLLEDFNTDLFELNGASALISGRTDVLTEFFNKVSVGITYENLRTKTLFIPIKTESIKFDAEPLNILMDSYGMPTSENFLGKQFKYTVELYSIKKNNEIIDNLLRNSTGLYNRFIETSFRRSAQSLISVELRSYLTRMAQASDEIRTRYLQLPAELPERVGELALEITSSADNDYDRVKAIESYLSKNYSYTLEPGNTPKDRDFVDYFLFDLKQGYCTYYASAMTVLVRSIGIPARYVEGYFLPSLPVQGTTYDVTNKQAHAWVEVYFEGFGWINFEPTSPLSQNLYGTPEEILSEESSTPIQPETEPTPPEDDLTADQDDVEESEVSTDKGTNIAVQIVSFIKLLVLAILVLMLWSVIFYRLRRKILFYRLQKLTPQQCVIEMYRHLLKAFSVQGLQIKQGETPLQYAQRIDENMEFNPLSFKTVTDVFIKARYSNMSIAEKEKQLVMDFYSTFPDRCKKRTGWLRYFVYNNLLGLI